MEKRKIEYRLGSLDWIKVPTDWHHAEGIKADAKETNMGLADRNYLIDCKTGTEPLMVVEGFWIWWCLSHNQPLCHCEKIKEKNEGRKLIDR